MLIAPAPVLFMSSKILKTFHEKIYHQQFLHLWKLYRRGLYRFSRQPLRNRLSSLPCSRTRCRRRRRTGRDNRREDRFFHLYQESQTGTQRSVYHRSPAKVRIWQKGQDPGICARTAIVARKSLYRCAL